MKRLCYGMLVPVFFILVAYQAEAATLYMDPSSVSINRGDTVSVKIRLDTDEGECVNTVDGIISYTENIVAVDTSRGSSILSLWLEEPTINKDNRTITFAAGIPNGYCGRIAGDPRLTNTVLELVFASPGLQIGTTESGNVAKVAFADGTRVLLNDGFGTDAPLRLFDAEITMSKTPGNEIANEWNDRVNADNTPPQAFVINLERTDNAFSNRYFITFNTTDKQSGIDYYEVIEEPIEEGFFNWGGVDAPWVREQSPYVLKDQSLNSIIRVRAYDKAGNEYVATLIPEESERTLSTDSKIMLAFVASVMFLVFGGALTFVLLRGRRILSRRERDIADKEAVLETDQDSNDE